jgi:hypothetical protein
MPPASRPTICCSSLAKNIHFPVELEAYSATYDHVRCAIMQGGHCEVKHWAFNDPPKREGEWQDSPPPVGQYLQLKTRITDLHPMTVIQNARTSGGGYVPQVPHSGRDRRSPRNLERRCRLDLAPRPVRHTPHRAHDQQARARFQRANVPPGRPPTRKVQLLPRRPR